MNLLQQVGPDIWTYDGSTVPWYGMPYTTRMTVVRLADDALWIHSPEKIIDGLVDELAALGKVRYLISPNKIHHLFLHQWVIQYPNARCYAAPGLEEKRRDILFDKNLQDTPEEAWAEEIDQLIFKGSKAMEEVVFFHRSTKTLILTDLIENFSPDHFSGMGKWLAKMTGIISPNGKTPVDWRLSFIFGKHEARACLDRMLAWQPENIIISHGECIRGEAIPFLRKSFNWLPEHA